MQGLLILYWSTSHLYRFTHTWHWPFTQMLNFHVHAVSLMGEPKQCSPPVWRSSQRVNDGKNNIHTLWKICTRHNNITITSYRLRKYTRCGAKKIYRLKEDQAFWLSLELGRREKVARHPSADFLSSPAVPPYVYDRQWRSFRPRRGWSGFCRYYVLLQWKQERDERSLILWILYFEKLISFQNLFTLLF